MMESNIWWLERAVVEAAQLWKFVLTKSLDWRMEADLFFRVWRLVVEVWV